MTFDEFRAAATPQIGSAFVQNTAFFAKSVVVVVVVGKNDMSFWAAREMATHTREPLLSNSTRAERAGGFHRFITFYK